MGPGLVGQFGGLIPTESWSLSSEKSYSPKRFRCPLADADHGSSPVAIPPVWPDHRSQRVFATDTGIPADDAILDEPFASFGHLLVFLLRLQLWEGRLRRNREIFVVGDVLTANHDGISSSGVVASPAENAGADALLKGNKAAGVVASPTGDGRSVIEGGIAFATADTGVSTAGGVAYATADAGAEAEAGVEAGSGVALAAADTRIESASGVKAPAADADVSTAGGVGPAAADARPGTEDGITLPSNETTKGAGKPIPASDD
jgi:hypothetical protein